MLRFFHGQRTGRMKKALAPWSQGPMPDRRSLTIRPAYLPDGDALIESCKALAGSSEP